MTPRTREFVIRQDHLPRKILRIEPRRITPFMRRLRTRFPNHQWSVSERFVVNGSD